MKKTALILALASTAFATACSTAPTTRDMLIGGAALAAAGAGAYYATHHDNKHHDDAQANQDDYQRGLTDARNRNEMNDRGSEAYVAGYRAGREERRQDRDMARARRHQDGGYVDVSDLVGARAAGAEMDMQRRGFENIDGSKGWHRAYTTWWNASAKECVQVTTQEGRYSRVDVVNPQSCY